MNGKLYKRAEAADFAVSLSRLMIRAGQVGLFRTMHKIHDAVRECGYEMADNIEALERVQPGREERGERDIGSDFARPASFKSKSQARRS